MQSAATSTLPSGCSPLAGVVDDDEDVRIGLTSLLRALGWSVITYGSAEELLVDELSQWTCLIVDQNMPGLKGLDLQRALLAANRSVPFIMISANIEPDDQAASLSLGAVAVLRKPFPQVQLTDALEAASGLRSAQNVRVRK
jgi:FixJ family two-component response regulator